MKGYIIIPVRNEEESISLVVQDLMNLNIFSDTSILVVDNGSTDSTASVVKSLSITYLYEEKPGYGNACLRGLEFIKSNPQKPNWVAFMDGDYSDYSSDLVNLIDSIERGEADLISGDRTGHAGKESLEFLQKFGNSLICKLISIFYGLKLNDLGPLRVILYDRLKELNMQDKTWGWNLEMNLKVMQRGLKIMEIPVGYKKRYSGQSKISGNRKMILPVGLKILYTFLKYLIFK
jgi:glycosyltransferase involved in cell wall biosynthesis